MKKTLVLKTPVETVGDIEDGDVGWTGVSNLSIDIDGNYWFTRQAIISRKLISSRVRVENRDGKIIADVSNCSKNGIGCLDYTPTNRLFVDVLIWDKGIEYKEKEA